MLKLLQSWLGHWKAPLDLELRKFSLLVVSFYLFLLFFLPIPTFDSGSYVVWSQYMQEHGIEFIYKLHYVNYMPLNLFVLQIWITVCSWLGWGLIDHFQYIKLFPLLFDCLTILLLLRVARRFKGSLLTVALLLLPNLAFHYNSFIWGQLDGVYTYFVLLAVYLILVKKPIWAFLAFVFALNSKIQAVIFAPALVTFAWLYLYQGKKTVVSFLKDAAASLAVGVGIQWLLFLPFSVTPPAEIIGVVLSRSFALSSFVTFNADNFWALIGIPSQQAVDTTLTLGGLSYHIWGLILFLVSFSLALLPFGLTFLKENFAQFIGKQGKRLPGWSSFTDSQKLQMMSLVLYIQSLCFFYFMTQMHERYSHPAMVFAGLFAILSRSKKIFFLTCTAYFLNLERINLFWKTTFDLSKISWISQLSAALYLIGLTLVFLSLYGLYLSQAQPKRST